jgi:quercetin dioxygenase-like cupin family protein
MVVADSVNTNEASVVAFEPGAGTNWHLHPAGQIVIALSEVGYYQEKNSPKEILKKGDVLKCPQDLPHWHGTGPDGDNRTAEWPYKMDACCSRSRIFCR